MEWNDRLEEMMRTRDFQDLGAEDRAWVLQQLTERQYQENRALMLAGKELGDAPQAPAHLQQRLQQAFRRKHRKRNLPLHTVVTPLWQAAAIAALFLLTGKAIDWAPVHAAPASFTLQADSLWVERLTKAVSDTAAAVFQPFQAEAKPSAGWLALQDSMAGHRSSPRARHLPDAPVDTPGWARRSAVMHPSYLKLFYRLN